MEHRERYSGAKLEQWLHRKTERMHDNSGLILLFLLCFA